MVATGQSQLGISFQCFTFFLNVFTVPTFLFSGGEDRPRMPAGAEVLSWCTICQQRRARALLCVMVVGWFSCFEKKNNIYIWSKWFRDKFKGTGSWTHWRVKNELLKQRQARIRMSLHSHCSSKILMLWRSHHTHKQKKIFFN